MKHPWAHPIFRSRFLLAIVAGLLWTCAFPKIGIAGLAWIAPGLMVTAALGKAGGEAFRIGYVAGLAHYLSMLYWLLLIPYRWHGLPLGPMLGWVALSAFLALFTAIWVWGMVAPVSGFRFRVPCSKPQVHSPTGQGQSLNTARVQRARPPTGESSPSPPLEERAGERRSFQMSRPCSGRESLGASHGDSFGDGASGGQLAESERAPSILPVTWAGRVIWTMAGAAAWVAIEMVLARILGGFPWSLLGVSQYQLTPLIQIASVTGVYGLSFMIVWVSLALLSAIIMLIRRPTARSVWLAEIFLPLLVTAFLFNLGLRQLRAEPDPGRVLKTLLIQPSIPQALIWDARLDTNRFSELVAYSDQLLANQGDLLIWPESAIPEMLRYDTNTFNAISNLAQKHRLWVIVGSDDMEPRRGSANPNEVDYFNSSFLISPEGQWVERYIKRSLVIFGEYVPLQRWLPFLKWFTPVSGGFTAGQTSTPFELTSLDLQTSVLICFEDIFPHLARRDVNPDTDFLVNITNDGWFGHSAAQWQHATTALFRAVENRVPLIRCCNNGLTCWVDAHGRVRQVLRDAQGTVYGTGHLRADIPLPPPGERHTPTFYTRYGDVFGWACVVIVVILLAVRLSPRNKPNLP